PAEDIPVERAGEDVDARAQLVRSRVEDDVDMFRLVAAGLDEQLAHAPCVVLGVAQVGLAGTTLVGADHERVRRDRVIGACGAGQAQQAKQRFPHGLAPLTRRPPDLGTPNHSSSLRVTRIARLIALLPNFAATLSRVSPRRSPFSRAASSKPSWRGASRGSRLCAETPHSRTRAPLRPSIGTFASSSIAVR